MTITELLEQETLNLLTEQFYVVEEHSSLREALGVDADDAQIIDLMRWRAQNQAA